VRVSKENEESGISPDVQIEKIKERCSKEGWPLVEVFRDIDFSGRTTNRPAYQEMMGRLNEFDVVLVYKLSRFGRRLRDIFNDIATLEQNGVDFVSTSEEFDTSAQGQLYRGMTALISQFYSDLMSDYTKDNQRHLVKNGRWRGGNEPYGFKADKEKRQLVPHPKEAKVVKRVVREYLDGTTLRQIAFALNREGIPTKMGAEWTNTALRRVLRSPHLIGKTPLNGELLGEHKGIINIDTWEKVQAKLRENSRLPAQTISAKNALSGLIKCSSCNGTMTRFHSFKRGKKCLIYICRNRQYKNTCPNGNNIRVHIVEGVVEEALFARINLGRLNSMVNQEAAKITPKEQGAISKLKRKKSSLESQQKRLTNAIAMMPNKPIEPLLQRLCEIEEELEMIGRNLEVEQDRIKLRNLEQEKLKGSYELMLDAKKIWPQLTPQEKNQIYRLFIDEIIIEKGIGPARVRIRWKI